MGGEIAVESEPGRGSEFIFQIDLPRAEICVLPDKTVKGYETAKHDTSEQLPSLRILVAEDNVMNQKICKIQLEKANHRVVTANNGLAVLELLQQEHFDVVLMDVQMPIMDGLETTTKIRQNEDFTSDHPYIIAITANALQGDAEACIKAGMNGYVSKPINWKELNRILNRKFSTQTNHSISL